MNSRKIRQRQVLEKEKFVSIQLSPCKQPMVSKSLIKVNTVKEKNRSRLVPPDQVYRQEAVKPCLLLDSNKIQNQYGYITFLSKFNQNKTYYNHNYYIYDLK